MTEVFRYSPEMIAFLRYHRFGISLQDITDAFNKEFKTNKTRRAINRICMKHGLKADVNHGQFKKGATKHNLAVWFQNCLVFRNIYGRNESEILTFLFGFLTP